MTSILSFLLNLTTTNQITILINHESSKQTHRSQSSGPERIIQFGEGNFLRAFVDWIIKNMNDKTDFNSSVVVVQGTPDAFVTQLLEGQDCLYHVNLQGRLDGEVVNSLTRIDVISRALSPFTQFDAFLALADQPEMRFVISNTTEAGIAFDPECKLSDRPAASYPGKLTQLLYRRFKTFNGAADKGFIIMPCELIFENGHHLKEIIFKYIDLWKEELGSDYEAFKSWFSESCYVCATLVDRIVPGFPARTSTKFRKNSATETTSSFRAKHSTSGSSNARQTSRSSSSAPNSPLKRQAFRFSSLTLKLLTTNVRSPFSTVLTPSFHLSHSSAA